jgi:hypothetical protein
MGIAFGNKENKIHYRVLKN